jgi:hypothetical protein
MGPECVVQLPTPTRMKGKMKEISKVMQLIILETCHREGDTQTRKKRHGHQTIRLFPL